MDAREQPEPAAGPIASWPHAELVATAEAAAQLEAQRRLGPGQYDVSGATNKACCVHLTIKQDGRQLARWRYELDGTIVDDPRSSREFADR